MPDERPGDGHCAPEVFVVTDEGGDDFAGVVEAEGAQDHRETEGDEAEAPDAADDVFAEEVVVLLLGAAVVVVEGALLAGGQGKLQFRLHLQALVEFEEAVADVVEDFFQGGVAGAGENVNPFQAEVEVVEDEAAEQAVLRIRDEGGDLSRCSGEDGGEVRPQEFYKFPVFSPGVGDGLVVEGLPEAVGVVAVVGGEDIGQGVSFGFEHQATSSVVGEDLIDGCGAGAGWNDEHPQGRLFGRFQVRILFLCLVETGLLDAVFVHIVPVELAELVMDGLCETSAEGEPAFTGGGRGRDVEEEVGIDFLVVIDAIDFDQAGGSGDEGSQDEDVGVFVGAGIAGHFVKEPREVAVEFPGEGGH